MRETLEEKEARLIAKHATELTKLRQEYRTLEALPAYLEGFKVMVHLHELYGEVGSVTVEHHWYAYGNSDRKQPTLDLLADLGRDLPPTPLVLVLVKDGSLSFRTKAHVEALPEAKKERWESETDVSPFSGEGVELPAYVLHVRVGDGDRWPGDADAGGARIAAVARTPRYSLS